MDVDIKLSGGTYPIDVHIFVCKLDELEPKIKESYPLFSNFVEVHSEMISSDGYTMMPDSEDVVIIWLPETFVLEDPYWISVLAHEIFHATEFTLDVAGIKYSIEYSNEAYAYQLQYLFKQAVEKMATTE